MAFSSARSCSTLACAARRRSRALPTWNGMARRALCHSISGRRQLFRSFCLRGGGCNSVGKSGVDAPLLAICSLLNPHPPPPPPARTDKLHIQSVPDCEIRRFFSPPQMRELYHRSRGLQTTKFDLSAVRCISRPVVLILECAVVQAAPEDSLLWAEGLWALERRGGQRCFDSSGSS